MTQPYKVCPNCQQPAALSQTACGRCGRPYRTQFAPPNKTQVFICLPLRHCNNRRSRPSPRSRSWIILPMAS